MSDEWRVVLQMATKSRRECIRFGGIPVVRPVHICIVVDPSANDPFAEQVFERLKATLSRLSGSVGDGCGGPLLTDCMARGEPACRSILVLFAGAQPVSHATQTLMNQWESTGRASGVVLPVLPPGVSPAAVLPWRFHQRIVLFRLPVVGELAADVLRFAGIGAGDYRLFISYRRDDAMELAEALHDEFTHEGFEVFLDRFRGSAGVPFPPLLRRELMGKGVVLVIESVDIRNSRWTLSEVAFARNARLGLVALAMPGAAPLSAIGSANRVRPGGWIATPSGRQTLDPSGLLEVVAFVRERYAAQSLKRRIRLENVLHFALAEKQLQAKAEGGATFSIQGKGEYIVHLSPRLPELSEVRRAATVARPLSAVPVLIGASRLLPPEDRADFEWMAGELGVALSPEIRMRRLAAAFASGGPLP